MTSWQGPHCERWKGGSNDKSSITAPHPLLHDTTTALPTAAIHPFVQVCDC